MALREVRVDGDPILRKECKPIKEVNERMQVLIEDMFETMYEHQGCGLAGPQIGILKQICVVDVTDAYEEGEEPDYACVVLINPEISEMSGEQTDAEGCLSVPGKNGDVTRAMHIRVKAMDHEMQPLDFEAEGFLARCIQHEVDHLHGILYTDKVIGELRENGEAPEEEEE